MLTFNLYAYTDSGLVRTVNEDHILMGRFVKNQGHIQFSFANDDDFVYEYGMLFAVADGIGGEAGGTFASQLALLTLEKYFYAIRKSGNTALFKETLYRAIQRANQTVLDMARQKPEFARMGCTLAGICLMPEGILLFHCGDSRIYYYNSNVSRQLTSDETIAQLAVNVGRITAEEARHLTQRHHLTNFLGYEKFTCQIKQLKPLRTGDHLLICSDGIHDLIEPNVLDKFLSQSTQYPLAIAGRNLAQHALNSGGDDNLSLILMQLSE